MKLLALFFAVIAPTLWAADRPTTVEELFQTTENLAAVSSPERVEVCILYAKDPWFSKDLKKRKYQEGKSQRVPPEAAQLLSAKLTDARTYGWDFAKACMPVWNARVKFYRAGHYVSADFCFGCDILILGRDGQPFNGEDFDGASAAIFEVIRSLFPKDRVIRSVLESKEREKEMRAQVQHAIELEKRRLTRRQRQRPGWRPAVAHLKRSAKKNMSMGSPGDSPITDLLVHGRQPFPSDIAAKIRKLAECAPSAIAELGWEPFEWEEGKKLDEARVKLDALLAKFVK